MMFSMITQGLTHKDSHGFSLVELLIAVAIMALLISLAAPSFRDFVSNQRVKTATQDLFTTLLYARSEAIKSNTSVAVVPAGTWQEGWAITTGTAGGTAKTYAECVADATNCFRIQQALPGITVSSALGGITFTRTGRMADPGVGITPSLSLCDSNSSATVHKRKISLDLSGRPVITQDGFCNV